MKNKKMDKIGFASTIVMGYAFMFLIVEIIIKIYSGVFIGDLFWEVILLFSMTVMFLFLSKDEVAHAVPHSFLGSMLPLAKNKKRARHNAYLCESMLVACLISVANISIYVLLSPSKALVLFNLVKDYEICNMVINSLLIFVLVSIIMFAFEYFICERSVNLYLEYLKKINLEKEEELLKSQKTVTRRKNKKTV